MIYELRFMIGEGAANSRGILIIRWPIDASIRTQS
jgi:hypothetical protein